MSKPPLTDLGLKLLLVVREAHGPVGTRMARHALLNQGKEVSESTISRLLRDLDKLGLTTPVGTKGRIPTPAGEAYASEISSAGEREEWLRTGAAIKTIEDVLNLLKARRAVEPEAAREAAERATSADIARLRLMTTRHSTDIRNKTILPWEAALEFHRGLSSIVANPLLKAMVGVVLNKSFEPVEAALDIILEGHLDDSLGMDDHSGIVEAIAAGNGELAESLMKNHLQLLTERVSALNDNGGAAILARLLHAMP